MGLFKIIIAESRSYVKKRGEIGKFDNTLSSFVRKAKRRQALRQWMTAILLGSIIPSLFMIPVEAIRLSKQQYILFEEEQVKTNWDSSQLVLVQHDDQILRLSINEYLAGVLLAEMGPSFSMEALKAQAVVARTYMLRWAESGGRHNRCTICTDHTCCQAWKSAETYLSEGGTNAGLTKVRKAISETDGMVLRYDGRLIDATYFSCSGGSTEDAVAVWGTDVPYLRSTPSPGEEDAPPYSDTVCFTPQELMDALDRSLSGVPETWFGLPSYTAGGGVDQIEICGMVYEGKSLRSLLGLRSTAFTVMVEDGMINIETRGFGHRVGMSQYGADAMAEKGADYQEILCHYYNGVTLDFYGR